MGEKFILPHGDYKKLLFYRKAEILYDSTSFLAKDSWIKKAELTVN